LPIGFDADGCPFFDRRLPIETAALRRSIACRPAAFEVPR
jgi:hypothetical protein